MTSTGYRVRSVGCEGASRTGQHSEGTAESAKNAEAEGAGCARRELRFLTREELADVLRVSVRTVDAMAAAGEVPCVRMRGGMVRFYLPDVVRHLTATALTRKRGRNVMRDA